MSYKKDFLEGIGSIYDIHGRNHFNGYDSYPGQSASLNNHWGNAGNHFHNSIHKNHHGYGSKDLNNPYRVSRNTSTIDNRPEIKLPY